MKKLPPVRVKRTPPWQKKRLARWLAEWTIDKRLAGVYRAETASVGGIANFAESLSIPGTSSTARTTFAGKRTQVSAGQIRLLYPQSPVAQSRLLYVAVMQEQTPARFLVAPFGKLAEPGLPGEWFGRSDPNLRVLCLWNARILPGSILRDGWLADHLTDSELADAQAVWESQNKAGLLPAHLQKQVGPPIVHPLDPRWNYQEEEKTLLQAVQSFAESASAPTGTVSFPERQQDAPSEVALAAETPGIYGAVSRFRLEGSPLVLRITLGPDPIQRAVAVVDENGQPSKLLDGSVLEALDGTKSPPILNAQTVVSRQLLTPGVVVVMPTGARLRLRGQG